MITRKFLMILNKSLRIAIFLICLGGAAATLAAAEELDFEGWKPYSPRDEIRPAFAVEPHGGPDGQGGLVIEHDQREGLDGAWRKTFEIEGGRPYQIVAFFKGTNLANPRAHVYAELLFHDAAGKLVVDRRTGLRSRPFYASNVDEQSNGWTKLSGIFPAPAAATHATVQLHLRWEPDGRVVWAKVSLKESEPRPPRNVRLAAINYRPRGGETARDNLRQLVPYLAKAAEKHADLVVLGECITTVGNSLSDVEAAESIPGPSTNYLGGLAKKYHLFIVTSLRERVDHLIYNTAVLLGPRGKLIGKYRKISPARDEYRKGIAAGRKYPVFDTSIGKIGMMICYDVHFPEVARGLAAGGAEIIAMPIMGGHPALAKARAIENQVYLVTSTYSINDDWMQSGVWGLSGELLVRATAPDSVVVTEVNLAEQHIWRANMGDFRSRQRHERPAVPLPR